MKKDKLSLRSYAIPPLLMLTFLSIAIMRLIWLGNYPIATSNDAGNWLNAVKIVLGDSWLNFHRNPISPFGLIPLYNLLVPWLPIVPLTGLVIAFGNLIGLKIFMVLSSVFPGPPLYYLLRKLGVAPLICWTTSIIFLFFAPFATMFAWANYDGLLGLSFFLLSLALLIENQEKGGASRLILLAVSIALTAGSDAMFFGCLVLTLTIFPILMVLKRNYKSAQRSFTGLLIGLAFSSVFFPVYYDIFFSRAVSTSNFYSVSSIFEQIFQSAIPVAARDWYFIIFLPFIGWFLYYNRDYRRYLVLSIAISSVLLVLTFFSYRSVRLVYLISVPIFLSFGIAYSDLYFLIAKRAKGFRVTLETFEPNVTQTISQRSLVVGKATLVRRLHLFFIILLTLILMATVFTGYLYTVNAYHFYEDLSIQKVQALEWVSQSTPTSSLFIASANIPSSPHLDFWINSLGERNAIGEEFSFVPDVPDLTFSNETMRAHLASLALKGDLIAENGLVNIEDSFPYNTTTRPLIGVNVGDYEPIMYLDWSSLKFIVNTSFDKFETINSSSFAPLNSSEYLGTSEAILNYQYFSIAHQASLRVTESLHYGISGVNITYSYADLMHDSFAGFSGNVNFTVPVRQQLTSGSNQSLLLLDKFGRWHNGIIYVVDNSKSNSTKFDLSSLRTPFNSTSEFRLPSLTFSAKSSDTLSNSGFTLHVGVSAFTAAKPLTEYTFAGIQKNLGFNYILSLNYSSDPNTYTSVLQWLEGSFVYSRAESVYNNTQVTIYKV